uniref:Uncharacterized protein n=1 Tax=Solanum tuberosum TaxID=4113 RepID=M1DAH5_SOLTU
MARPKVPGRNQPPQKKAKVVVIATEVSNPRSTRAKVLSTGEKGIDKGKKPLEPSSSSSTSDCMGIDSTHLTTFESEQEANSGSKSSSYESEHADDQLLKRRRAELRSKALHDLVRR